MISRLFSLSGVLFCFFPKQGKMNKMCDEESVGEAGYSNEFAFDEAPMEIGIAGAIFIPSEIGNVVLCFIFFILKGYSDAKRLRMKTYI